MKNSCPYNRDPELENVISLYYLANSGSVVRAFPPAPCQ